jgi:hypothetical protein
MLLVSKQNIIVTAAKIKAVANIWFEKRLSETGWQQRGGNSRTLSTSTYLRVDSEKHKETALSLPISRETDDKRRKLG